MLPAMTTSTETAWQAVEAPVRGYLRRRLGRDDALVDDLAQEVLVRLDSGLPHLAHPDRLGAWVMRIARNVLIDHVRRDRSVTLVGHEPETDPDVDATLPAAVGHFLLQVLEGLPEPQRAVVQLADIDGVPGPEAARRLGISLSAFKARLHRARAHVRAELEHCCEVIRDGRGAPMDYRRRQPCTESGSCSC